MYYDLLNNWKSVDSLYLEFTNISVLLPKKNYNFTANVLEQRFLGKH